MRSFKTIGRRSLLPVLLIGLIGCAAGCTAAGGAILSGPVFTWVTVPLTQDLDNTPVVLENKESGSLLHVQEPFSGYGIYAKIDSDAIGDIARKHGLRKVYFADQETFSIMGVWKTETVHVYGEK